MNRQLKHILLTAGLSTLLGSSAVSAQDQKEVAKVPFTFKAGHQLMPAGDYTVTATNATGLFEMSDNAGHSVFVSSILQSRTDFSNPNLTFACWGSNCLLAHISTPDGAHYGISKSSIDKDLNRQLKMASLVSVVLRPR